MTCMMICVFLRKLSTEKMHNLKVENYALLGRLTEDLSLDTASHIALKGCSK